MTSVRRILGPIIAATILISIIPATNVLAWDTSCTTTTKRICLWKDADYGTPKATTDNKKSNYVTAGDYPNTSQPVNDSVSSIKNKFASTDVRFYEDSGYHTLLMCVPQSTWVANIGSANDKISSHKKGTWC